jgi:RNA polymerase sigma factor (TIGR02999 family)
VTELLAAVSRGEPGAPDRLIASVYAMLRELASGALRSESQAATLSPTSLVHEAWLKLARTPDGGWAGRAHFFGAAGRAMRQVLVEHARHRQAARRDRRAERSLDEVVAAPMPDEELLAVDEALLRLAQLEPRQARVVELRYFVGLSIPETAEALEISEATVKRDWAVARAWLQRALEDA